MLELKFFREDRDKVISSLEKRGFEKAQKTVDEVRVLDMMLKVSKTALEQLKSELKQLSAQYHKNLKFKTEEELEEQRIELQRLGFKIDYHEQQTKFQDSELEKILWRIPNIPHISVPEGRTAEDNELVLKHGEIPSLYSGAQPHWELIKKYDIIDFELGAKISGEGFPVYKGKGARIQRAMINFFLDEALKVGYTEVQPPILINEESGFGTGQLPDKEGQMYFATEDKLYLIPTAEVPITNMYRDVILPEGQLPIKNVGYTPCFRREAGSWGAHVRGLNRLHQFDKVEIVRIEKRENSYAALEEMSLYVQSLLQKLALPYRVLRLCGGDMGFTSALTYDMEVWSAAQERWLEVSSVSNFETYQANRLKLRSKIEGKMQLLHTLNGSALALPRILASILENNQTPDGIRIPAVLVPYCGFDMID